MRRLAVLLLTVTFCAGFTDRGIAGPFGLSMGMKPAEVGGTLEKRQILGLYQTTEVPKPHSSFDLFALGFGPKTGLCTIIALGKPVVTNAYGRELRDVFDQMEERLSSQYGKHQKVDVLAPGSIWNDPRDFMMGLLKKERTLGALWTAGAGATLKDNLREIKLEAHASSPENSRIFVRYDFQNQSECEKELHATEDDAL